jgi:hypothetical protein
MFPLSIHDQIQKYGSIGMSRHDPHMKTLRTNYEELQKTVKTSMDLLFSEHKCLKVCLQPQLGATFVSIS